MALHGTGVHVAIAEAIADGINLQTRRSGGRRERGREGSAPRSGERATPMHARRRGSGRAMAEAGATT